MGHSKFDPLVEKVDVLQAMANTHYAHIRYSDSRATTVSTKHLAPCGQEELLESPSSIQLSVAESDNPSKLPHDKGHHADKTPEPTKEPEPMVLRRS